VSRSDHHGDHEHGLERDVKLFFALTNAVSDAGCRAWDNKRAFDSVRPITAIRTHFRGQTVRAWAGPTRARSSSTTRRLFRHNDRFGGSVTLPAGSSRVEPGAVPGLMLSCEQGDLDARATGRVAARLAWQKAREYWEGT
jgi:hypothetical protein